MQTTWLSLIRLRSLRDSRTAFPIPLPWRGILSADCRCFLLLNIEYFVRPAKKFLKAALRVAKTLLQGTQETLFSHENSPERLIRVSSALACRYPYLLLPLIKGIRPPVQNMVINEARTAKRLGQQLSLSHCKDSQLIGGSENRGHWHGSAIPPH